MALSISPSDELVYRSASYGIGQIMGSNYSMLGYNSAKEMYYDFDTGYTAQIEGMFSFIEHPDVNLVIHLENKNLYKFAEKYNGTANAATYEKRIRDGIEEYKNA